MGQVNTGTGEITRGGRARGNAPEGSAEVLHLADFREDEGTHFGSIGLPETVGWYVSAALYWIGAIAVLMVERFAEPGTVSPVVGVLATFVLAVVPFLVLGARYMTTAWWGTYVRILFPLLVLGLGAATLDEALPSLLLITMFPTIAVAYLHPPKIAIPYCLFAIANMAGALAILDHSASKDARVVVLSGSLTAVAGGLIYAQQRVRRAAELNRRLSVTDPLTGLANLRRLQSRLDYEVKRSNNRSDDRIVLFAIDLDDFKIVNDKFSYELGDRVLRAVATELTDVMEPGDLLVRRGGDEFAVLTLHRNDRDLDEFEARIARAIEHARLAVCPELNPKASVSRAEHLPGESAAEFLQRIDDRLHDAKLEAHPERCDAPGPADPQETHGSPEHFGPFAEPSQAAPTSAALPLMRRRDLHVGWYFMGAGAGVPALLLAVVAATGLAPDLRGPTFAACIVGMLALAAFSVVAGLRNVDLRWSHVSLGGSMALMTLAIAQAEQSSQALVELYAIQPPLAIYILGRRAAIPYLAASVYFYSSFLIASDFDGAPVRILIFVGILCVLSLMLARGQRTVNEFYRSTAQLTVVDPLTGVGNLRALRRRVEDEIDRCRTTGEGLSILVIDLDGFKQVNDQYSHTIGDKVLIESARAINRVVREDELVARRGGDEFAVVCARKSRDDADALADRIANAVRDARSQLTEGIPTGATVRAVHWDGVAGADEFMRRSDIALHDAKAERDDSLAASG